MITIVVKLEFDTHLPSKAYEKCKRMLDADEAASPHDHDQACPFEGWESTDEWFLDGDLIELYSVEKTRMRRIAMDGES